MSFQAQPSQQSPFQPTSIEEVRTLWIGDLQYWADENYLNNCFAQTGEVLSIKIIRNKITGHPEGYGFVEFVSHQAAERILQTYNGTTMPGTEQTFRLNWASFGIGERRPDGGPEHSIFVGDLAPDVTDYLLQETFRVQYSSVRGAKVVTDPNTGRSKGYGFVKFADEVEKNRAMSEMNGIYCSTRPMRISAATPRKATATISTVQPQYVPTKALFPTPIFTTTGQTLPADNDMNNEAVIVSNLDPNITEEELKQVFIHFGELAQVKIPETKGCGFLHYVTRTSAEDAIQRMQGAVIGQQSVRLSLGKIPTTKQESACNWGQQADTCQWSSAYYTYGQGYDPYSYEAAQQDPSLYQYGAYAGYSQYAQQPEVAQEMAASSCFMPNMEQREELHDPLSTPDVDKLNSVYMSIHGGSILGRPMWMKTWSMQQHA